LFAARQAADAAQYTDTRFGYSLIYPDAWHTKKWAGHPGLVVLRSFPDNETLQGGDPPFGGAQIRVSVFPPYPPGWSADTDEYAKLHSLAASEGTIISESTRASGAPARVKWNLGVPSETNSATCIWTVLRVQGRIIDISLDYCAADPAGPQYEHVLSDVIASLWVSDAAPDPSAASVWELIEPPELLIPNPAAGKNKPASALWATQVEPDAPGEPIPKIRPYLIRPPDLNAPLFFWRNRDLFESEAECKAGLQAEKQKNAHDARELRALRHAQCIEQDELRAKIKMAPWVDKPPASTR